MKKIINPGLIILVMLIFLFAACKKPDLPIQEPPFIASPRINTTDSINTAPIINAGPDIKLEIPYLYTKLPFTAYDAENNIKSYTWTKISGPESYYIQSLVDSVPELYWIEEGEYQFELMAADTKGLSGKDTVKVTISTNLRKYVLHDLQPDASWLNVIEIPEEVKNNIKWVYGKSAGYCEMADAGRSPNIDYTWGGYYYELLPGNKISVYGGYTGYALDIIIYYL